MKQLQSIHFYFDEVRLPLEKRQRLKVFIAGLLVKEKKRLNTLNYIFCSDKTLLEINRKYLNHNFYTDVITFDLSSSSNEILADIYISVERVRENAKSLNLPLSEEIHRVMFHGLLHLCGYNDKTATQTKLMRTK